MAKQPDSKPSLDPRPPMEDRAGIGDGVFCNITNISMNGREVFLDFGMNSPRPDHPTGGQLVLQSRVILTVEHAAELHEALGRTLEAHLGK